MSQKLSVPTFPPSSAAKDSTAIRLSKPLAYSLFVLLLNYQRSKRR